VAVIGVVIAYDISDDDARAEVAALLSRHGVRLQRSVFQCELAGAEELAAMLTEVYSRADPNSDVVHMFRQCVACASAKASWGQVRPALDVPYWIV
jgi:CRISPR-associated protein Cas2